MSPRSPRFGAPHDPARCPSWSSIRAAVGVAPVFVRAKLLVAAVVAPDPAGRLVVGRNEAVAVAHAAIVRGFHLVPDDVSGFGDAVLVDAHRLDPAAHHEAIDPRPRPLDLAFEMAAALGDPRRSELAR